MNRSTNGPDPQPDVEPRDVPEDADDDPAHSADEGEGWTSEGGATPAGAATDVDPDKATQDGHDESADRPSRTDRRS